MSRSFKALTAGITFFSMGVDRFCALVILCSPVNPEPAGTVDMLASRSSRSPGVRLQPCFLFMWLPSRLKPACCGRYDIAVPLSDLKRRQVLFENDLGYTNSQRLVVLLV